MKKIFRIGLIMMFSLYSTFAFAETLLVCGNVDKAPKQWAEKDGSLKGIWIEIIEAIDEKMPDIDFELALRPWKRAYKGGEIGKNAMMGMFYNDKRGEIFDFSEPVLEEQVVIVVKKGKEFKFDDLNDLKDKVIGIYGGTSYGTEWQKAVDARAFSVVEDFDNKFRLRKILNEKIDGGVFNPGIAAFKMICDKSTKLSPDQFTIIERPVMTKYSYFAIAKKLDRKALINEFNDALGKIKESGEYQKILDKYVKDL